MSALRTTAGEHVSDDDKTIVDARPLGRAAHDARWGQETTVLLPDQAQSQPSDVRREVERNVRSTYVLERFGGFRSVPVGLVTGFAFGLIAVLVLVFWVHRERQISNALRAALELADARARASYAIHQAPSSPSSSEASEIGVRAPAELTQSERVQIERRGADSLVANDYRAALDQYLVLSAAFPSETVFADMVRVLRSRLRCRADRSSRGPPCP